MAFQDGLVCSLVFSFLVGFSSAANIGMSRQNITLSYDGGYEGMLLVIDPHIPESLEILSAIQEVLTLSSSLMHTSTAGQHYLKDVVIVVPSTWSDNSELPKAQSDQTVNKARVVIAPSNMARGETPYTLQPGLCSIEGDFVHITADYLSDKSLAVNVKAKRLLKEFAKLLWGVYDEDVPVHDFKSSKFYTYENKIYPTKCSESVEGIIRDDTSATGGCTLDSWSGLPTSNCQFIPSEKSTTSASLMYNEHITSVDQFCTEGDDDDEDKKWRLHDFLAPNRQNRICGKSVSEVLAEHPDFAVDYSARQVSQFTMPPPSFTIVQRKLTADISTTTTPAALMTSEGQNSISVNTSVETREDEECTPHVVCLTLDTSGSMSTYDRITKMSSAVSSFILNHIPDGSVVGITQFATTATQLSPMTQITGDADRYTLVSNLPSSANGLTDIDDGLALCKQLLESYAGQNLAGTKILLLSDGEDTIQSIDYLIDLGITVDTIAYSQYASTVLSEISDQTGGLKYFTGDNDAPVALQDAFLSTIQQDCSRALVTLVNEQVSISPSQSSVTLSVYIDSTLGDDTKLVFSYSADIDVNVTTPNNNPVSITKDPAMKLISVKINGRVTGTVYYTLSRTQLTGSSNNENVVVTITSLPTTEEDIIRYSVRKSTDHVTFSTTSQVDIYVDVFKGYTPVESLTVNATISTPAGSEVVLQLHDDGAGMDSIEYDGLYTGTLNTKHLDGNGYYNLKIDISGKGYLSSTLKMAANYSYVNYTELGEIQRTFSGGLLIVTGWYSSSDDNIPPGRIRDLTLVSAVVGSDQYVMVMTIPGGDVDTGAIRGLDLKVSSTYAGQYMPVQFTPNGGWPPEPLSYAWRITVNASQVTEFWNGTTFGETCFFKIRSIDDSNNWSDWSNIVVASFANESLINRPVMVGAGLYEKIDPMTTVTTTTSESTTTTVPTTTTEPTTSETPTCAPTISDSAASLLSASKTLFLLCVLCLKLFC